MRLHKDNTGKITAITMRKPDDMHLHLRQDRMLYACLPFTVKHFARALVMPNTLPPVKSADSLLKYREIITAAAGSREFTPLMTFKLYPGMASGAVEELAAAGATAGKLYPEGSTTNSEDGVKSWKQIREALSAMEKNGIVLSIHGEKPDSFVMDRERDYLTELYEILDSFPSLRVVLEHVSSEEGVRAVEAGPPELAATITAHHLLLTLDDLAGGGLNPHNFCKPIVKTPRDRDAVRRAAFSGSGRFFFGSDSAPHPAGSKLNSSGSAGIFSSPCALQLLVSLFEKEGRLDMLEDFTSSFGAKFYRLPPNREEITLEKKGYKVPGEISGIVPLFAGADLEWSAEPANQGAENEM